MGEALIFTVFMTALGLGAWAVESRIGVAIGLHVLALVVRFLTWAFGDVEPKPTTTEDR